MLQRQIHRVSFAAVITLLVTSSPLAAELDQYMGYLDLHDEDRVTGRFTIGPDDEGRLWFWTPEGNAFFGCGVNKMSSHWIEAFNRQDWVDTYQGNRWIWGEQQREKLLGWSFNSIAYRSISGPSDDRFLFGDPRLYRRMQLPYAPAIFFTAHGDIEHLVPGSREDFLRDRYPDVWSDEWAELADVRAERLISQVHSDPFLIGYYMGEEPHTGYSYEWGKIWADYIIDLSPSAPGKAEWVAMMEELYVEPAEFNQVYGDSLGYDIAYFDELFDVMELRMVSEDAGEFTGRIMSQYAQVAHSKLRKYDSAHLILGIRNMCNHDHLNKEVLDAYAPYVDAFSFNAYGTNPDKWDLIYDYYQKPIIISETSYLADDTGYNNDPYPRVPNQRQRGRTYRWLVTELASKPFVMGIWWHAYYDHGEDTHWRNWGLIDPLTDTPYQQFLDYAQPTNEMLFDIHSGLVEKSWWGTPIGHVRAPR